MSKARSSQFFTCIVLFAVFAVIPLTVSSAPALDLAIMTGYYLLLAASWNLLAGYTGQYSFAHLGLAAVGAYSSAFFNQYMGIPVVWTFILAGAVSGVIGLGLGFVSLRVKGVALPLITFGFAGAFEVWLKAARDVTEGTNGLFTDSLFSGLNSAPYLWMILGLCLLYYLLQTLLITGRWGLYLTAVRDNEVIAEGLGVNTFRAKLISFAFTAVWAGIAGAFYAAYQGIIAPSMMDLSEMGLIVVMVVVGGIGRPLSAILGVVVIQVIGFWTRGFGGEYTLLIVAALCLPIVLLAREGVAGMLWKMIGPYFVRGTQRWEGG